MGPEVQKVNKVNKTIRKGLKKVDDELNILE